MANDESTTRRQFVQRSATALAAGAVAVPSAVISTAAAVEPDPIFALIEAHKAAMAEYSRLATIWSQIPFEDEAYAEANEATQAAADMVSDAQLAVVKTSPTTVAGVAAVLEHVAGFWIEGGESADRGFPIYENLASDELLDAGDSFSR
jgi:hypothetical protein